MNFESSISPPWCDLDPSPKFSQENHFHLLMQARDQFYQCVAEAGIVFSIDVPIPASCAQQRQAYEKACRASWVRHFDISQDKELKILKSLRNNINASAATATGGLQGADHREK